MTQSITTARDIPLLVTSTDSCSERRITPSWTIAQLKSKLEPVTGIASSSQKLTLRLPDREQETRIETDDEDMVEIGRWPLVAYAELKVTYQPHHFLFFSLLFLSFLFFSFLLSLLLSSSYSSKDHHLHRKPKPINRHAVYFKFGMPQIEKCRLQSAHFMSLSLHLPVHPDSIFRVASLPSVVYVSFLS